MVSFVEKNGFDTSLRNFQEFQIVPLILFIQGAWPRYKAYLIDVDFFFHTSRIQRYRTQTGEYKTQFLHKFLRLSLREPQFHWFLMGKFMEITWLPKSQFSSFLSFSLYQSPPRGGKERLGRENTVVSVVSFGEMKKTSEIDTYINPGLWKD